MKVRLIGLYEETRYTPINTPYATPAEEPQALEHKEEKVITARIAGVEEYRGEFAIPGEMVRGAEIGCEFMLILERFRK